MHPDGDPLYQGLIEGRLPELTDDAIDAVVAAYVAWAAHTRRDNWADLLQVFDDADLLYPLGKGRTSYWFP